MINDIRSVGDRRLPKRGAIAVVTYVAFIIFFAYFPFDGFSREINGTAEHWTFSTTAFLYLLVPATILAARSAGLVGSLTLPFAFILVMKSSVPECEGCTFDPARVTLYGIATFIIAPTAIIGGLASLSERRGRGCGRNVRWVGLTACLFYALMVFVLAQIADPSFDFNRLDWIEPTESDPDPGDISWVYFVWIASVCVAAVGYQLPWRLACIVPLVFVLATIEAREPGLGSGALFRALLLSLFVILPCSLLGAWLRRIADRRAIGANETTTGVAGTEHGPPAADH